VLDRWDPATILAGPLDECVYASRLLGADPSLVLHGGGNTSVKTPGYDVVGNAIDVIHVKGSGHDLATITAGGFTPLDNQRVAQLVAFQQLSDTAMMNALRCLRLDSSAPDPSVEAILHAVIPRAAVLHTHADAILALTDTPDGADRARQLFGPSVLVVDYVMPGFPLAKRCADVIRSQLGDGTPGMVLMRHGIFTFADDTRSAYRAMIELVSAAEAYLAERRGGRARAPAPPAVDGEDLARLRAELSRAAGRPLVMKRCASERALRFAADSRVHDIASRGPATPDHVLRTKRVPLIGRDVDGYEAEYRAYFAANAARSPAPLTMLDPAPRIVIDPAVGLLAAGRTPGEADIALDVYTHTIDVIEDAEDLGGYRPIGAADCFDVEYWELEQAKLGRQGEPPALAGEVALVTGAASGIGRAIAERLLHEGAAVVGFDIAPEVTAVAGGPAYSGIVGDVRDPQAVQRAFDASAERFGGLDIVVIAAGVFPPSARIADLDVDSWRRTMEVNLDGGVGFLRAAHPMLRHAPSGGRVVIVGSRNVRAPGPGAAAYSAAKAALNQVARVAALEWAADGIRVNSVHPDAVFDTGLWTDDLLASRAASYGLTVEAYKRRNLLGAEITSRDVADLVTSMCTSTFAKVTGAQIPIDGGSERVI
jgi:rhamnose utilization protein RhaD (predicted bifunctional aldolase and dehydrogenase)/NAD(P)-dependent dehydrogenase (short-subunit alcohol dehydrogenase family)